ncbi:MAG: hypothetical protein ACE5R4_08580 [Armatimonadota bacterium]
MTRRRYVLKVLAAAVALGLPISSPTTDEAELSLDECRQRAAKFLGVTAGELAPRTAGSGAKRTSDLHPTTYTFILPYPKDAQVEQWQREVGRVSIVVEARWGRVTGVTYQRRRYEIGTRELTEADAKRIAAAYLKAHWPYWPDGRFYSATKPSRPGAAARPVPAATQSFHWVVEQDQIRLGQGSVHVNLTTGKAISYSQHYCSAEGLSPARVTKQQAINAALSKLDKQQRAKAKVEEAYLATGWYKGRVRLVWVVWVKAPARMPPSFRGTPPIRTHGLQLDAHTGQVYMEVR